ncbi:phosphatidate cytidylyltransferase [Actinocatenispora thailandica]|uniref:Phosphatidate cytidylyltransferase n=1 Tax=Actinocatenispora thailandica TaxID=227318 RepID=A0A7R7DNL2_9ACTN|nr:phosphatidate cytidylyltransferase [Actinocatenispora thailandica]BCJ34816.1 phosphatidate cytidylyltransferase [Actinocatenispora thailandica]
MAGSGPFSSYEQPRPSHGRHRAPDADDPDGSTSVPPATPADAYAAPERPGWDTPAPDDARPEPDWGAGAAEPTWDVTAAQPAVDPSARYEAGSRAERAGAPGADDSWAATGQLPAQPGAEPGLPGSAAPSTGPDDDPATDGSTAPDPAAAHKPRAGRNLPAAIGVGVGLGAIVLASLYVQRAAFLIVVAAGVLLGTWETVRAFGRAAEPAKRTRPPLVPLLAGAVAMQGLAWFGGLEALTIGLVFTLVAVFIWRLADGPPGYRRDVAAGALIAAYVPFLAGFAVLLARPEDGAARVVAALAMVVCSDTGGYTVGVLVGRHKMAPRISPGKSWEGFAGSVLTCAVAGAILVYLVFHQPLWAGVVFGVAVSLVSVLGDLTESMIKRDLGIKDMGNLLPGHGGVMDRLDSILFAVPVSFALLSVLAPAG